ncbi:hypothetical protein [Chitinasiproducens palmae]|uniref:Uncharacterized protein n=1 Tax=Chitinasiproducens palmae TaxID=1770053 RepID=A0A1H2PLE9_9BURK|nr:hypothetical protein [Chitinasiproducens palmae]SDV46895.1 hypothetical protein SAMN05216551_10281 [Chitinasiproducens palmae]
MARMLIAVLDSPEAAQAARNELNTAGIPVRSVELHPLQETVDGGHASEVQGAEAVVNHEGPLGHLQAFVADIASRLTGDGADDDAEGGVAGPDAVALIVTVDDDPAHAAAARAHLQQRAVRVDEREA